MSAADDLGVAGATVYLSGAITADPAWQAKFRSWEARLLAAGARRCLSPVIYPPGWAYGEYMEHCMLMVRHADTLVMLPDWRSSPGARAERAYGESLGHRIIDLEQVRHGEKP